MATLSPGRSSPELRPVQVADGRASLGAGRDAEPGTRVKQEQVNFERVSFCAPGLGLVE
jgi:hypothetical protein